MGPAQALRRFASGALDFSGRAGRAELAWVLALHAGVMMALSGLAVVLGAPDSSAAQAAAARLWWLGAAWVALTVLPSLALVWRRLHDLDTAGWWALAFVPLLTLLLFFPLALLCAGLALSLIPGTPARNRFGPRPGDRALGRTFD